MFHLCRSKSDSQQRYTVPHEEPVAPLPNPTLSKLKLQDDLSSSADCLLEHQDGGNPQAGLSTPVISQKISKRMTCTVLHSELSAFITHLK